MQRKIFQTYLQEISREKHGHLMLTYDKFLELLWEANQKINLVSRKTNFDDYWTLHLLDSLLPVSFLNFSKKRILDFGSGGGLPGIPLNIYFPDSEIHLLDSKKKKIAVLKKIIKELDLKKCFTIVSRIEEIDVKWSEHFDFIVCRSVKIEKKFLIKMMQVLKPEGKIFLYKSRILEDLKLFKKYRTIDISHSALGSRKLIEIEKTNI